MVLDPKLFTNWSGAGAHCNFSTEKMRNGTGGMELMTTIIEKLKARHKEHLQVYGEDNEKRLTGAHETSSMS